MLRMICAVKRKGISYSWKIQITDETLAKLQVIADSLGGSVSPNGVAAMAVFEIAQVPARDVWLALGAIRQFAAKVGTIAEASDKRALRAPGAH